MAVVINLSRGHTGESWGFRLAGGTDFGQQLCVKKVAPNTPAAGQLHPGDAILGIGGSNTGQLTHMQAHQLIKSAGNFLQLTLLKHAFAEPTDIRPKGPVKFTPWKQ